MRFLVFGGLFYYAQGGWSDALGQGVTLEQAKLIGDHAVEDGKVDWVHVVDLELSPPAVIVYRHVYPTKHHSDSGWIVNPRVKDD